MWEGNKNNPVPNYTDTTQINPISANVVNPALDVRRDQDPRKNTTITLLDIDTAVLEYLQNVINPTVVILPPTTLAALVIVEVAEINPAVKILPPVTLPVAVINPTVVTLPPVTLPVAVTNPTVVIFPPVTLPTPLIYPAVLMLP